MTEKLSVVREFAVHGDGNFEKLKGLIDATYVAWAADYGQQGVLVTYPIHLGSDELVDRILKAVEDCGYHVTKTRSRTITGSMMIMPGEDWKDFAEFEAFRQAMRNPVQSCAVEGILKAVDCLPEGSVKLWKELLKREAQSLTEE